MRPTRMRPETSTSWDRGRDQDKDRDRDRDQKVVSRPRWSRDLNILEQYITHRHGSWNSVTSSKSKTLFHRSLVCFITNYGWNYKQYRNFL